MATTTYTSNSVVRDRGDQVNLTADTTLVIGQSGTTFFLDAIGEVITLPPVADCANVDYKFICSVVTATTDWTIVSATDKIQGSCTVAGGAIPAANENTITLVVAKFLAGDWITLESDGVNWYVAGQVVTTVGCTFTAP